MIGLIVARSENGIIGNKGKMPWYLPADLRWFRKHTLGKPCIMGRKTFDSLNDGQPLPNRTNIVVTRGVGNTHSDVQWALDPQEALWIAAKLCPSREIMVIGGAEVYRAFLPIVTRIYLTIVYGVFEGDTTFPKELPGKWNLESSESFEIDEKRNYAHTFQILNRDTMT